MKHTRASDGFRSEIAAELYPFLGNMSQMGLERISAAARISSFPGGAIVVREGQPVQNMLLVDKGAIRVFKSIPEGRQITLYRVLPGDGCILMTYSILNDAPFPASAIAEVDTQTWLIPGQIVRDLFADEPAFRKFANELVMKTIAPLIMMIDQIAFHKIDQRLATFLLATSATQTGAFKPVMMTHEEIASHLGTAREVVSRCISSFESDSLIEVSRRFIRILDAEGLRRIADSSAKVN
jgi:CRP/FNR family transcriptional regulator, anaerobic regulatory protein